MVKLESFSYRWLYKLVNLLPLPKLKTKMIPPIIWKPQTLTVPENFLKTLKTKEKQLFDQIYPEILVSY